MQRQHINGQPGSTTFIVKSCQADKLMQFLLDRCQPYHRIEFLHRSHHSIRLHGLGISYRLVRLYRIFAIKSETVFITHLKRSRQYNIIKEHDFQRVESRREKAPAFTLKHMHKVNTLVLLVHLYQLYFFYMLHNNTSGLIEKHQDKLGRPFLIE